jgi:hypothetical protein
MKVLCSRCHQNEANTCATGRWLCWSCFHLEADDLLDETGRLGEDRLGETSRAVLAFIQEHIRRVGIAPTTREIVQNTSIASTSSVDYHLARLAQAGKIRRLPNIGRGITLVPGFGPKAASLSEGNDDSQHRPASN